MTDRFEVPDSALVRVKGALPGTPPLVLASDVPALMRAEVARAFLEMNGELSRNDREYLRDRFPEAARAVTQEAT